MLETTLKEANRLSWLIKDVESKINKFKDIKEKDQYVVQIQEKKKTIAEKDKHVVESVGPTMHLAISNTDIIRQLFQNEIEVLEKELTELKEKFTAL